VENAFTNVNQTLYGNFDPAMLNRSAAVINESIEVGQVPAASYLFATLRASNASVPLDGGTPGGGPASASSSTSNNTDLAM
jgi:hypothetical protein